MLEWAMEGAVSYLPLSNKLNPHICGIIFTFKPKWMFWALLFTIVFWSMFIVVLNLHWGVSISWYDVASYKSAHEKNVTGTIFKPSEIFTFAIRYWSVLWKENIHIFLSYLRCAMDVIFFILLYYCKSSS